MFLSRFAPEKGAHIAIEVARKLNKRLVLAGNLADKEYFRTRILPYVDGRNIRCEIEVSDIKKKALLANAKCLLAPISWDEPFGLFMIEALACGTPVIASRRGAAPEVIKDRETGFVVDSVGEMIESVKRIDSIDPRKCRKHVLDNFDTPVMVDNYLAAYRRVISRSHDVAPELFVKN